MESQNVSQQENQKPVSQPNPSGNGKDPHEGGSVLPPEFVGLPPATEDPSAEERLVVAERYVSELLRGYQAAGQAINRLETHLFSLFKILFDNGAMTWESFVGARDGLMEHEDLTEFWGVKEIAEALDKKRAEEAKAAEEAKDESPPSPDEESSV